MAIELPMAFILTYVIKILISSFILYLSVRWVGGEASFVKSIVLVFLMEIFSSTAPIVIGGYIYMGLSIVLWLILVMGFFKLSFGKAILVAIAQIIVGFVLSLLGIIAIVTAIVVSILVK